MSSGPEEQADQFALLPHTNIVPGDEGSSSSSASSSSSLSPQVKDGKKVLEGLSILLVEDQAALQRIGVRMMTKLGARVTLVRDGESAVEAMTLKVNTARARRHGSNFEPSPHYDLILMDCQMKKMNGCEATRAVRKLEAEGGMVVSIPIIAFTASHSPENKRDCYNAGMDYFLKKPSQEHLLAATILETISRKNSQAFIIN